ncbi:unnamed protein product [Brassicogethes aeneus]|uniref:Uncharacterized protein n=1 Tax=Brassicogethes aeneus TaxID=1431903 RepID=A0A9P0FN59_BRAAE|nr:unnamed protein product [Brassicogethes aeneus]
MEGFMKNWLRRPYNAKEIDKEKNIHDPGAKSTTAETTDATVSVTDADASNSLASESESGSVDEAVVVLNTITQKRIKSKKGEINAVYIPPDVDELTDEENIDEDLLVNENGFVGGDIAGSFEIHINDDDFYDSSDNETIDKKRQNC